MSSQQQQIRPTVECLEDRSTPAAVAVLQGSTLLIQGTSSADTVLLTQQNNHLILSQPGLGSQTFPLNQIRRIVFQGFSGADDLVNQTGVVLSAFGGAGADLLVGGTGRNTLFGQAGNDTLVGNPTDRLVGGAGTLFAPSPLAFQFSGGLNPFLGRFSGPGASGGFSPQLRSAFSTLLFQNASLFSNVGLGGATFGQFGGGLPPTGVGLTTFLPQTTATSPLLSLTTQPTNPLWNPDAFSRFNPFLL